MAVSRQADLRANQKARTRAALVDAARALLRENIAPTVPDAAERAQVSRATAYRYFPTQESLLTEISVAQNVEPVEQLLRSFDTDDVEERLVELLETMARVAVADEVVMRTALRLFQEQWLENRRKGVDAPVREGRRMRWLDEVLAPLRDQLSAKEERRLHAALALTLSIEPVIILRDVCRIDDEDEMIEILDWAATTMLRAALEDAEAKPKPKAGSRPARR